MQQQQLHQHQLQQIQQPQQQLQQQQVPQLQQQQQQYQQNQQDISQQLTMQQQPLQQQQHQPQHNQHAINQQQLIMQQVSQQQMQMQNSPRGYTMPMHNNVIVGQHPGPITSHWGYTTNNNIFLRIRSNVNINMVTDYLKAASVNVIKIEKVSHSLARFNSFKICVQSCDYSKVLNDPFWSLCGAKCMPWSDKGSTNFSNNMSGNNGISNANNDRWDKVSLFRNNYNYGC